MDKADRPEPSVAASLADGIDRAVLIPPQQPSIFAAWNDTAKEYPRDACIHHLLEAQVERSPDAIAVTYQGEQLSYAALNRRANQLAHLLRELGVGPEVLVGLLMERSLEMIVATLAILKAGGAYLPLDPPYPNAPPASQVSGTPPPRRVTHSRTSVR